MCRPGLATDCQSQELVDYSVNAVGSLWARVDGKHMVEFMLMNDEKLVVKRMDKHEQRHYRHHDKKSRNKYTNKWGNHYVFTSNHTGYYENGKTGKKTHIRRTRPLNDFSGMYHAILGGPTTIVIKANELVPTKKGPASIKTKRADDFRRKKYDRVDTARNLYVAEDGETIRFRMSPDRDHMEAVWTSHKGYKRTFKRIEHFTGKGALEGDWKIAGDEFEITKQKKNSLTVKNLNGNSTRTFKRKYDNAFVFEHGNDWIGVLHSGFWVKLGNNRRQPVERDRG